ncbi:MAG: diadenylate cyclase [Armatimonadota bacterium]
MSVVETVFKPLLVTLRELDVASTLVLLADILAVAYLLYRLILLAKGTRAWQIMSGLFLFFLLMYISGKLGLSTLNWLMRQVLPLGPVALVILFYPELRHVLEEMGRLGFWGQSINPIGRENLASVVNEVVRAATEMAKQKVGALIVFEPYPSLDYYVSPGVPIDAKVNARLLTSLFYPGNPLHDGAVVICGDRIVAAGCTLPLTENPMVDQNVHMRHKAAIAASELVVSEETGIISVAFSGRLQRGFREDTLRERLMNLLTAQPSKQALESLRQTMRWRPLSVFGRRQQGQQPAQTERR